MTSIDLQPAVQDTGWRVLPMAGGDGAIYFRRIAQTVNMSFALDIGESGLDFPFPDGFTFPSSLSGSKPAVGFGDGGFVYYDTAGQTFAALGALSAASGYFGFFTDDPWPEVLPGEPAT